MIVVFALFFFFLCRILLSSENMQIGESPIGIIDLSTCLSVRSGMRKDKKVISVETPGRTYYLHADNFSTYLYFCTWFERMRSLANMFFSFFFLC